MSISPIGFEPGLVGMGGVTLPSLPAMPTPTAADSSFSDLVASGLEQLQGLHTTSDALAVRAATGDLTDVHDYMIASTEAGLATEMTVAVRNRAVEAFSEIMRMQV